MFLLGSLGVVADEDEIIDDDDGADVDEAEGEGEADISDEDEDGKVSLDPY